MFAAASAVAGLGLQWGRFPFPGHRALAVLAFVAGVCIALAGVREFRRSRTTVNPLAPDRASAVVSTGIYRFTRNPMYLGMAVSLLALALWWASVPGLALVLMFCAYLERYQIRPEERALTALFGRAFSDYAVRVRRWL